MPKPRNPAFPEVPPCANSMSARLPVPTPPGLKPYVSSGTITPSTRINWPARPVDHETLPEHPAKTIMECPARKKWHAIIDSRRGRVGCAAADGAAHGQLIHSSEELLEAFDDYVQSLDQSAKWATKRKGDRPESTPMQFPAFLGGFLTMLGVGSTTWARWKGKGDKSYRADLVDAMHFIERAIHVSQVHQASTGLGNTTVLTRLAELYEKHEVRVGVDVADMSAAVQSARDLLGLKSESALNTDIPGVPATHPAKMVDVTPESPEPDPEPDEGDGDDAARDEDAAAS